MEKTLVVLLGPTAVGKTELSLRLAQHWHCPIINADSRQVYFSLPIGTAAPTPAELQRVQHYLLGHLSLSQDYNAGEYERDAMALINQLFAQHDRLLLTGGSMLYIDAVCRGLDDIPSIPPEVRQAVQQLYHQGGVQALLQEVQALDPQYAQQVDAANPQRLMHCIEVCRVSGTTYSSLRRRQTAQRPFRILKFGLQRPREQLYLRINQRVQQMMAEGLLDEAKRVLPWRNCNSLQTVGYRELFEYLDGNCSLDQAVEKIQQNTRHYAKRQMTWFRRDKDIYWLDATMDYETLIHLMDTQLCAPGMHGCHGGL